MEKKSLNLLEQKKEQALSISIKEGSSASISSAFGDSYITPFALALKAQPIYIGIMSSLTGLIGPIFQIVGTKLMKNNSRKKIVLSFVLLQALLWVPLSLMALLFWKGLTHEYALYFLILGYSIIIACGGIVYPAWFSWMGDLVPEKERGKFFSKRNKITGAFGLVSVLIAAFLLDFLKSKGLVMIGFALLLSLAALFRLISYFGLKKQYHPKFNINKKDYFSLTAFLGRLDNFGKFALFNGLLNLTIMIASPFFAVYLLEELKLNYFMYMCVTMSSSVFYLVFAPLAGKFSDRFGNRELLIIASFLFALNPLLWIFIKKLLFLILIPQLVAGIANAALVIGVTNFTYDAVSPKHRGICVAYTNILAGIGTFLGSLIGGALLNYVKVSFLPSFAFLFLIASLTRFSVALFLIPKIKEVRKETENLPPVDISLVHPFKTLKSEVFWIKTIVKNT